MVDFCNAQAHIENELLCHRVAGMDDHRDLPKQSLVFRQSGCRLIFAYPYATDSADKSRSKGMFKTAQNLTKKFRLSVRLARSRLL